MPTMITAPKVGSCLAPTISSQPCSRRDHGLHGDALDARPGAGGAGPRHDALEGLAHRGLVLQVERHAAHVGLVGDVGREDLQHHRVADVAGGARRLVGARASRTGAHRDAVGLEQRLRGALGEDVALRGHAETRSAAAVRSGRGRSAPGCRAASRRAPPGCARRRPAS